MASKKSKAITEVFNYHPYKERGLTVDIQSTGFIALRAGKEITNDFMHRLSKEDSEAVLNIIRISINEEGL